MRGYSKVASLMAAHDELAIVRGYKSAYALDILYHQVELFHLLQEWAELVGEDRSANDTKRRSFDTYLFNLALPSAGDKHCPQWVSWLAVRQKLREYRQAITTYRQMIDERPVDKADLKTLRDWLKQPGGGDDFLRGSETDLWQEDEEHDFINLSTVPKDDVLFRWATKPLISLIHHKITHRFRPEVELRNSFLTQVPIQTPLKTYSNTKIEAVASVFSVVLASLFPAVSMLGLTYVKDQTLRLQVIVVLNVLFSIALALIAKSTRVECFAVTAAFAAVQVVFVGQQGTTCA